MLIARLRSKVMKQDKEEVDVNDDKKKKKKKTEGTAITV
jgi:hypothetical protein